MFKVNDTVLYGKEGVCKIVDITDKNFNDTVIEYFVLQPVYQEKSTIFVPTRNEVLLAKMRRVLSEEEIYDIIKSMPDEKLIWIDDDKLRKVKYKEILDNGNQRDLVKLIKTLYLHQQELLSQKKKMHIADENFLREAERMLYDEFALVLDIKQDQVLPFILNLIQLEEKSQSNAPAEKHYWS